MRSSSAEMNLLNSIIRKGVYTFKACVECAMYTPIGTAAQQMLRADLLLLVHKMSAK